MYETTSFLVICHISMLIVQVTLHHHRKQCSVQHVTLSRQALRTMKKQRENCQFSTRRRWQSEICIPVQN